MRRFFQKFIPVVAVAFSILVLGLTILTWSGLVAASVLPIDSYRPTGPESAILDNRLAVIHQKMSNGDFDSLRNDLIEARISARENLDHMRSATEQFGFPIDSEFFRSSYPEPAARYFDGVEGMLYTVSYFTRTPTTEYSENIDWVVTDDGRARIRSYSASKIADWQKQNRSREKMLAENLPHAIRIPIAGSQIEIRY
jgi:hypothetical protein